MNVNDSEHIAGMLKASGMQPVLSPEKSSLIIINTCAVREKSEEKLYSLLGRYGSIKKNRKVIIGIVGCVAQLHRSKLWDRKPFLDFIIGPDNYWQIPQIISSKWKEKTIATHWSRKWHELPHQQILRASQVTSYITIMEGCNNFCTYCVVPYTRGREKYRPMDNILEEAKDLAGKGYKEIQLLGQNVNTYTDPISGKDFPSLLEEVSQIDGIEWIRFITSHPKNFTEKLAKTMKRTKKVCRQLHLPIQSGSTKILQQMNINPDTCLTLINKNPVPLDYIVDGKQEIELIEVTSGG
jgi:tRNA-2-methylthio-N6-dimethylallyladenosine synthase